MGEIKIINMKKYIFVITWLFSAAVALCQHHTTMESDTSLSKYDNLVYKDFKADVKKAEALPDTEKQLNALIEICKRCNYCPLFTQKVAEKMENYYGGKDQIKGLGHGLYECIYYFNPTELESLWKHIMILSYLGRYKNTFAYLSIIEKKGYDKEKIIAFRTVFKFIDIHTNYTPQEIKIMNNEQKNSFDKIRNIITNKPELSEKQYGIKVLDEVANDLNKVASNIYTEAYPIPKRLNKLNDDVNNWMRDASNNNVEYYNYLILAMVRTISEIGGDLWGELETTRGKGVSEGNYGNLRSIKALSRDLDQVRESKFASKIGSFFLYEFNESQMEVSPKKWISQSIRGYQYFLDLDSNFVEARWRLANVLEFAGLYESAIIHYRLLLKSPLVDKRTRNYGMISLPINLAEEATAHIIVCRFLMKNRPANITAALAKDTVMTTAMLERMDFSDQAIQQRSGFEPIKQMVEEVEKKQNYKTKDPNIKGKVIDVALLALGWAIAPKDMKVEQRNQFIMGTLSTVISLIDKDKVNVSAGGLSSSGMLSDLADLKTNPAAKNAEAAFSKVQPPAKATTPVEEKKVETAGGVTITDKWEVTDISGEWEAICIQCIDHLNKGCTCNGGNGKFNIILNENKIESFPFSSKPKEHIQNYINKIYVEGKKIAGTVSYDLVGTGWSVQSKYIYDFEIINNKLIRGKILDYRGSNKSGDSLMFTWIWEFTR